MRILYILLFYCCVVAKVLICYDDGDGGGGGGGPHRGRDLPPPKGLMLFNTNTGISVPLLRVRPNTFAIREIETVRERVREDPAVQQQEGAPAATMCVVVVWRITLQKETLIEIYVCAYDYFWGWCVSYRSVVISLVI